VEPDDAVHLEQMEELHDAHGALISADAQGDHLDGQQGDQVQGEPAPEVLLPDDGVVKLEDTLVVRVGEQKFHDHVDEEKSVHDVDDNSRLIVSGVEGEGQWDGEDGDDDGEGPEVLPDPVTQGPGVDTLVLLLLLVHDCGLSVLSRWSQVLLTPLATQLGYIISTETRKRNNFKKNRHFFYF